MQHMPCYYQRRDYILYPSLPISMFLKQEMVTQIVTLSFVRMNLCGDTSTWSQSHLPKSREVSTTDQLITQNIFKGVFIRT